MPRRRIHEQTRFGDLLDDVLHQRGLTIQGFCAKVGCSPSVVTYAKTLTLNPERIERWADALALVGDERTRFIDLAWLAHSPPHVQVLVERQRERIAALEKQVRLRRKRSRS